MTKIGGMQHVKGNTSGVVIWLLEKKNDKKTAIHFESAANLSIFPYLDTGRQAELERQLAADDDYDSQAEVRGVFFAANG